MATTTSAPLGSRGGHLVFGLVLVVQALLLSSQVTTEGGHSALRALLIGLFSPIQRGADAALGAFSSMWYGYVDLRGVREENGRLKEDVARLEQALWMERDLIASYRRLSSVLEFAERIPGNPIVAEVVGLDASAWFRTITVNRGTAHGVALNAPVIAAGGLVGRGVAVLVGGRGGRGVVAGSGEQASPTGLTLNYVSNLEDVVEGDLIVTSGMDGIYPKGIAIGRVGTVRNGPRLFKLVTVEPAATLDRLEEVFILEAASFSEVIERVE